MFDLFSNYKKYLREEGDSECSEINKQASFDLSWRRSILLNSVCKTPQLQPCLHKYPLLLAINGQHARQ